MARGIGGEDGPSLWTFVAVIVVWGAFKTWMAETKADVKDTLGIGKNTAGPFQAQTSKDIETAENTVKGWNVTWSACPRPPAYYQNIADKMWREMNSSINIDEAAIIALCKPLNKNELMAVAKSFGVKEAAAFGFTTWSGHIFQAMEIAFDGMFKGNERAEIHRIWAVTKLW